MKSFTGKLAVITGGNSGIGYATAKELKEKGAVVIITGKRKEAIEKAASELDVIGLVTDQSNLEDIVNLKTIISKQY